MSDTSMHHPLCDTRDVNAEGIAKPCNCPFPHRIIVMAHDSGEFITEVDGFVYYLPRLPLGYFSAAELRVLADELDRRNAAWQGVVQNDPLIGGPEPGGNA